MSKLHLVRHAEPEITGVLLGQTNPPLSEAGRARAAAKLAALRVKRVYTSPLRRCTETAEFIDAPLSVIDAFREIHLGEWDGLNWSEIERRFPELAARKAADWFGVTPPGGEPWAEFSIRVRAALVKVLDVGGPAAIVGHVAVNAVIAEALSGATPASFNQNYCGVLEFDLTEIE